MTGDMVYLLGWMGMYAPMAMGAIGSIIGCAIPGQTACGAMLDVDSGYGRFIGVSAMPSSQTIYGIVVMFTLQNAATDSDSGQVVLTSQNAYGIFAIGVLVGLVLLLSAIYQGRCCAAAINASKSKPAIFGLSVAPAAIVEGFAVFAFVFALVLCGSMPEVKAPDAAAPVQAESE
ncbi:MAG: ATP synthase subunit C [Pirellulaceae bacterium]